MVTPADQFAEAMQEVVSDIWNGERPSTTVLRTMARAFADAECDPCHDGSCKRFLPGSDGTRGELHAACIADFFRECGLEGDHAP